MMNDIDNLGMIGSKMPHSHSTPAGVDGGSRTPPITPRKAGKMLAVKVQMLDDKITMFQVQAKALGRLLFDQVCKQLNLLEADYFGLEYQEPNGTKYWLDLEKPVCRQVGLSLVDPLLRFCVKFYTPDPGQLEEEFTRYLFCLQIKRDLAHGLLQCNDNTAALMASYIVQAECGDYVIEDYPDHTYLSTYKFVPHQDHELERRIMENHKRHAGQSPAEADLNLLETARRCELYGMKMHQAKDHEGVPLNLAVAHMGIVVFQGFTKINTFSWAKIRKISFKRKRFLIKLHPEGYGYYKDTVEFFFDGRNECKNFWKKCVENHGFFRCSVVKRVLRQKTRVLSRGSSFRYSGKTQKQIVEFVRENYVKRQTFQRSNSFRQTSGGRALQGSEGGGYRATPSSSLMGSSSISAHPLLPLGDPALGTPALSLSCGSMTLDSPTTVTSVSMGGMSHRRDDTATSYRTLTSIDVHTPATPNQVQGRTMGVHQQQQQQQLHQQQRITSSTDGVENCRPEPQEEISKGENNNLLYLNGKPDNQSNGGPDMSVNVNVNVINSVESSPEKSSNVMKNGGVEDTDIKKTKRWPTDKAYYIAKELLMTERTYKKDLDVINVWFREEVARESDLEGESAVGLIELLADAHGPCLQEMEARLARWENNARHNIGDFLYNTLLNVLPLYDQYLEHLMPVLEKMEYSMRTSRRFDQLCKEFEAQKYCYLPLSSFLLKPLQRLLHYNSIIDRLLDHYPKDHTDFEDCLAARDRLGETLLEGLTVLNQAENLVQLCELQRDISGFENLVQEGRRFIRQGCLQTYSHKGYQQRMFFLFSDILLYTFRVQQPTQCFRVHGQLPLKGMTIKDGDNKTGTDFVFVISQGSQSLTVAANNEEEKERWLEDLNMAITQLDSVDGKTPYLSLKSSILGVGDEIGLELDRSSCGGVKASQRSNSTVHVCWHRNTSISYSDQLRAFQNQLSGFLLRKFNNSDNWQKLWVVFTNFCLFFYKSHQDDFSLACLPLLGYTVSTPSEKDRINKEFVFKLQFKRHEYFFRAESEYTFGRWMEVIRSATQQSHIPVNFAQKENY